MEKMEYGPVDVVIIAAGEPKFDGSILSELESAAEKGIIRVLDAMVLIRGLDGDVYGVDLEDLPAEDKAALGFIETGTRGLFDAEDSATLAEGLAPGSAVVALAIEHKWAIGLVNSLWESGAEMAISMRIPAPVISDRLAAIAAGAE
jgi:hypothetical protein